jgi:FMN-dependent NADH-azoreductase
MPTLLQIDASPRGDYSISRKLSAAFVDAWKAGHPDGKVVVRDLEKTRLTFVDLSWIGGAYSDPASHTPEQKQALSISNELTDELLGADEIVLATPMYNFAVPAAVKAWIDHVVRAGKTFKVDDTGYHGLATGKKATFLIASMGEYGPGTPSEGYNQETPYLQSIFGFMGITDTKVVHAGGTSAVTFGKVPMEEFVKPFVEQAEAAAV